MPPEDWFAPYTPTLELRFLDTLLFSRKGSPMGRSVSGASLFRSAKLWQACILAFALAACSEEDLVGNGQITTVTRSVPNFDTVKAENGVHVILAVDPSADGDVSLDVTTDSNLHERLVTIVSGRTLTASVRGGSTSRGFEIAATVAALRELSVSNGAVATLSGEVSGIGITAANGGIVAARGLVATTADVDAANGAVLTICVTGTVTGTVANGAVLTVACGGNIDAVRSDNAGIVIRQ